MKCATRLENAVVGENVQRLNCGHQPMSTITGEWIGYMQRGNAVRVLSLLIIKTLSGHTSRPIGKFKYCLQITLSGFSMGTCNSDFKMSCVHTLTFFTLFDILRGTTCFPRRIWLYIMYCVIHIVCDGSHKVMRVSRFRITKFGFSRLARVFQIPREVEAARRS